MAKTVTLMEVLDDGQVLVIEGGRRIRVHPGDIPAACVWSPTCELQITEKNGTVSVRRIPDRQAITGEWA